MIDENISDPNEDNRQFFRYLSEKVENNFQNGPIKTWTQRDFIALSESIYQKTGEHISVTTLKRVFGKVEYAGLPFTHTLNILARFAGFTHWLEFKEAHPLANNSLFANSILITGSIPSTMQKAGNPTMIGSKIKTTTGWVNKPGLFRLGLQLAFGIALLFTGWQFGIYTGSQKKSSASLRSNLESPGKLTYLKKHSTGLPMDVAFNYSGPVPDPSDLTVISTEGGKMQYFNINKDGFGKMTYSYKEPGLYHAKIFSNNHQLAFCPVLVNSNGWLMSAKNENTTKNFYPDTSFRNPLGISKSECYQEGIDTNNRFYTSVKQFRRFGLNGDSFTFTSVLRNPKSGKELNDGLLTMKIRCGNFPIIFQIARWTPRNGFFVQLSEKLFENEERKSFTNLVTSLWDWRKITVTTGGKKIRILLDNTLVLEDSYKLPLGEVLGLEFEFAGAGEIGNIKLSDYRGIVWQEAFLRSK